MSSLGRLRVVRSRFCRGSRLVRLGMRNWRINWVSIRWRIWFIWRNWVLDSLVLCICVNSRRMILFWHWSMWLGLIFRLLGFRSMCNKRRLCLSWWIMISFWNFINHIRIMRTFTFWLSIFLGWNYLMLLEWLDCFRNMMLNFMLLRWYCRWSICIQCIRLCIVILSLRMLWWMIRDIWN